MGEMEPLEGIEPPTYSLRNCRSLTVERCRLPLSYSGIGVPIKPCPDLMFS
jgi:hypothetical protein